MRILSWLTATAERRICLALLALCAMLYVPLAGNYGMWDPWETHYGEVARQMLERNDFISQWWPGSPQDRAEFWSKPVLTFWLMAISMKLFGLEWGAHPPPSEMADSWRIEWAARLPFIVLSIAAIWAVWEVTRRLVSRRAGLFAAIVLATASQWALITRQAMTDMPFVVPMTVALAFGALALLLPEEEREAELPRAGFSVGKLRLSWPRHRAWWAFVALFVGTTLPQLIMISIELKLAFTLGSTRVRMAGIVPMLPYFAALLVGLWWCARARNKRQLYLFSGYVLCGLASLGKGPAGVALPAIVLVVYLVVAGRWKDVIFKLEIPRGILIFVANAFPWYHAMLIRHGIGFWNEFIGDNYVHRAGGRHGDRGQFDYYMVWSGYGLFPWSGVATVAGLLSFKWLREGDKRRGLVGFALIWFIVEFSTMALVNTKFHHYILPALPAIAILTGIFLDELLTAPRRPAILALLFLGAPLTFLCGRDLSAFPPRILWLFNYDYVNMPGTGRPWPLPSLYGDRYEYQSQIMVFAIAATLATIALAVAASFLRRRIGDAGDAAPAGAIAPANEPAPTAAAAPGPIERDEPSAAAYGQLAGGAVLFLTGVIFSFVVKTGVVFTGAMGVGVVLMARGLFRFGWATRAPIQEAGEPAVADPVSPVEEAAEPVPPLPGKLVLGGIVAFAALLTVAILIGPKSPHGAAPTIGRSDWLWPTLLMLPALALAVTVLKRTRAPRREARPAWYATWGLALIGVVWSGFLVDKLLIELSPHWAQKHVIASYFAKRTGPEEPLIAWQLYWRGENFYTKNAIYNSTNPDEKTVFLGDHNAEKMQHYFKTHPGRRVFFVVERTRFESLRGLLPDAAKPTLTIVDDSNNKIYLATAQL